MPGGMYRDVVANNQNGKNPAECLYTMKQWWDDGFRKGHARHDHLTTGGGKIRAYARMASTILQLQKTDFQPDSG